jgi:dCMP deaminase
MQRAIILDEELDRCVCNHAEANAIMNCVISGVRLGSNDNTLYTTFTPCLECSKMAMTVGIRRIVYLGSYFETDQSLFQDVGITVVLLEKERMKYWIKILLEDPTANLIPE